jgi:hypothetical protein
LGRLRPFVRHKRPLTDLRALLDRQDLDLTLVSVGATKENTPCASLL